MFCIQQFIPFIIITLVHHPRCLASTSVPSPINENEVIQELCWTENYCRIIGFVTRIISAQKNISFSLNLNCLNQSTSNRPSTDHRFQNIELVTLNGCTVNRRDTLGIEYIPDPGSVRVLELHSFHISSILNKTFSTCSHLTTLKLHDNSIADGIESDGFAGLNELTNLVIQNNNLNEFNSDTFTHLKKLQNLTIGEPSLLIGDTLKLPNLNFIGIRAAKMEWPELPASIQDIRISNTVIDFNGTITIFEEIPDLRSVQLTKCNVTALPKIISKTLETLNVSNNSITKFSELLLNNLVLLDISANKLDRISVTMLQSLNRLQSLQAAHNLIESIDENAFNQNPNLHLVNLTNNRLRKIYFNLMPQRVIKIFIDNNPWNCEWVLNMHDKHSDLFASFVYENIFHKGTLNIGGLQCQHDDNNKNSKNINLQASSTPETVPIVIEAPDEQRKPKNTAIWTVVILTTGVSFLFLMLFLYIKCRSTSQQPFYRTLPYHRPVMSDRTDYIRRVLPPTDYEAPISSFRSESIVADAKVVSIYDGSEKDMYEEIPEPLPITGEISDYFIELKTLTIKPEYVIKSV